MSHPTSGLRTCKADSTINCFRLENIGRIFALVFAVEDREYVSGEYHSKTATLMQAEFKAANRELHS